MAILQNGPFTPAKPVFFFEIPNLESEISPLPNLT